MSEFKYLEKIGPGAYYVYNKGVKVAFVWPREFLMDQFTY